MTKAETEQALLINLKNWDFSVNPTFSINADEAEVIIETIEKEKIRKE